MSFVLRAHYQHPGDDGINAHIPAYGTHIEQESMVHFFFHRCCCNVLGSQNVPPSTEAYISWNLFFYVLFITNNITDALSDLSWTVVLVQAEMCVENRTVSFFPTKHYIPGGGS